MVWVWASVYSEASIQPAEPHGKGRAGQLSRWLRRAEQETVWSLRPSSSFPASRCLLLLAASALSPSPCLSPPTPPTLSHCCPPPLVLALCDDCPQDSMCTGSWTVVPFSSMLRVLLWAQRGHSPELCALLLRTQPRAVMPGCAAEVGLSEAPGRMWPHSHAASCPPSFLLPALATWRTSFLSVLLPPCS